MTGYGSRAGSILLDPKNLVISDDTLSGLDVVKLAYGYAHSPTLSAFSLGINDRFGSSSALNATGNILVVGAPGDDTGGTDRGAAYFFNLDPAHLDSTPTYRYKLADGSPGLSLSNGAAFGTSLALNGTGNILAVGAEGDPTGGAGRGAAYLFNLNPARLGQAPTLGYKLSDGMAGLSLANGDALGHSVALNATGSILAIGANHDAGTGSDRGAAYLFNLNPNSLITAPILRYKLSDTSPGLTLQDGDQLGSALALNATGNILAVGAIGDDTGGANRGAAYLFSLNPGNLAAVPTYRYKLADGSPGVSLIDEDAFGSSLALNATGNILAVGARGDSAGFARGASYLFNLNPSSLTSAPTFRYKLANGSPGLSLNDADYFGISLALNAAGDILAVGASADDTGGSNRGAAYLFNLNPSNLTSTPTLRYKLANGSPGLSLNDDDQFGSSLALNGTGDILAVGARGDRGGGFHGLGAAYLFDLSAQFGHSTGLEQHVSASLIGGFLGAGNNVTLQASNDIELNSPLVVNNASGAGGHLTLQAGRSITINSSLTTDDGNLSLLANTPTAQGTVNADRDAGAANITFNANVTTGNGTLFARVQNGGGLTNRTAGNITIANGVSLSSNAAGNAITLATTGILSMILAALPLYRLAAVISEFIPTRLPVTYLAACYIPTNAITFPTAPARHLWPVDRATFYMPWAQALLC